jgi:hypothetical protein
MFKQTEYKGYDVKAMEKFYNKQFKQAKKLRKTDEQAHELAAFFLDYYKHQFRAYA